MKRKFPNKSKAEAKDRVLKALNNSTYKYRTLNGLARDTHLDPEFVKTVLDSSTAVRKSFVKSKSGKQLYASKEKVSATEDLWVAFQALNSAKFGN
ncbi:hypothetical protein [Rhodanobacter sp. OK091]|uniref:hypothetical protein n=1 Tax=Rhodanobacter sp. OK091 TaxID=1881037 RepID=UPI0009115646|nr:hypothetical protein [Rhodanobacter sp. OK091]SHM38301.1 hypothetical protein SAMN05428972_3368 [Rhodanobacter sp. OK091]